MHRKSAKQDHAFLINSMPGGKSERLAAFKVDEKTTFRKLRRTIEVMTYSQDELYFRFKYKYTLLLLRVSAAAEQRRRFILKIDIIPSFSIL